MNGILRDKSKLLAILVTVLLGCLLASLPVLAENTGDGSGGGQDIPLDMVSSSPADGQEDIPINGDITVSFNKNVIYLLIRDANKTCFSLLTADGTKVPVDIIMADDQTPEGFEQRRDVIIRPLHELKPGTAYIVKISPELQAKNGMSLGHEDIIHFVTDGNVYQPADTEPVADTTKPQANPDKSAGENNPATSGESISTPAKDIQTSEETVQPSEENSDPDGPAPDKQMLSMNYILAAGLILLSALGYVFSKKRKIS